MGTNSMHVAKTGLNAQQRRMQVIENNLANVNTTGFKRERVNFETLLYKVLRSSGEQTSADTNLTSAFSVAPNPAQDFITVTLSDNAPKGGLISLMTSEGKEVETRVVSANKE